MATLDTGKLIVEIKKRPAIYDTKSWEYNDRNSKTNAWYEVCQAMAKNWNEMTTEQQAVEEKVLRNKWRNIRDYFTKEIKMESKANSRKRKRYSYFDQLLFLMPNLKKHQPLQSNAKPREVLDKKRSARNVGRVAHMKKRKFYGNQHVRGTATRETSTRQRSKTSTKIRRLRELNISVGSDGGVGYRSNTNPAASQPYKTEVDEIIIESDLALEVYNPSGSGSHDTNEQIREIYHHHHNAASNANASIQMRYTDPLCETSLASFDNEIPDISSGHGSQRAHHDDEDYDKMFLLSLLPSIRRIPEHMKLHVRIQMQQVIAAVFHPNPHPTN